MTTATLALAKFLLARIAEDEAVANAVKSPFFRWETFSSRFSTAESDHGQTDSDFVDTFDPTRVLAECVAKRAIVAKALALKGQLDDWSRGATMNGGLILHDLAQPYASHPDFRAEWRA